MYGGEKKPSSENTTPATGEEEERWSELVLPRKVCLIMKYDDSLWEVVITRTRTLKSHCESLIKVMRILETPNKKRTRPTTTPACGHGL